MGQMEPIIAFRNFSFKYRSQVEPTLKDINLEIYPGEKVLIVATVRVRQVYTGSLHEWAGALFV